MNRIRYFLQEAANVRRMVPPADFLRWLVCLVRTAPKVIAHRSLGPTDIAFGETIRIRQQGRVLQLEGASLGVAREIFGRECYISARQLEDCRTILDLGANAGTFTLFALHAAPSARVHAVEAQPEFIPILGRNVALNGYRERVTIENVLVGGAHDRWSSELQHKHPGLGEFRIGDYLDSVGECDFLKCDVEGAEFTLFAGDLGWVRRFRRMALEYHGPWERGRALGDMIRQQGFTVDQKTHGVLGYLFAIRT